jgi:hypothetical protein
MASSRYETEEQTDSPVEYHAAWRAFALRKNLAFALLLAWVPVCLALFFISRHGLHQPVLAVALMLLWLVAACGAVWWAGEFRCPRCRRRYAALGHGSSVKLTGGLFDQVCSNCKLTKFERQAPPARGAGSKRA